MEEIDLGALELEGSLKFVLCGFSHPRSRNQAFRQVPSLGVPPPWPQGVGFPLMISKPCTKMVFLILSMFYFVMSYYGCFFVLKELNGSSHARFLI